MKKAFVWMAVSVVFGGAACSDSIDSGQGFSDTFRADDTVAGSIFAQAGAAVPGDFRITVVAEGVSSGFVKLNDDDLMSPNDFKNRSFEKTMEVSLFGENTLEVEIRGKPGDQLCIRVYEVLSETLDRGIYERCVDREAGPPNNVSVVILPNPTPVP